jgi:site-specific DNA-cytosine methylase
VPEHCGFCCAWQSDQQVNGAGGARVQSTGLVRHVFRLLQGAIDRHRPVPWVLLENVEALLDRQAGRLPAAHHVTAALEALGYRSWAQRVVCSAAFGVPQRRRRVFIVAAWYSDARDVLLAQARRTLPRCCDERCACARLPGLHDNS